MMTYNEAVDYLSGALKFGINPSLAPIEDMCANMGDPQKAYKSVQIAGTNGKSSTSRMIAALLHSEGFKVGLYTSPHLVKYSERIEVDGTVISDQLFAQGVSAAVQAAENAHVQATEFELLTAAAFWVFAHENVDWAVLECGLGGRWDATSVVTPEVAVITGVALEHTQILGDTVEQIAAEKAAIIKSGSSAIFASDLEAREVFEARANEVGVSVCVSGPVSDDSVLDSLAHLPKYQVKNAATALTATRVALGHKVDIDNACQTFANLVIPGRFEMLSQNPLLIVDAAHNPQSVQTLAQEISSRFVTALLSQELAQKRRRRGIPEVPVLLLGVLADKDVRGIVRTLCPLFKRIVVTASSSSRSIAADELAHIVEEETGVKPEIASSITAAKHLLVHEPVIATGSITVAGEVKAIW